MPFDPDQFLAETQPQQQGQPRQRAAFDPDQFLLDTTPQESRAGEAALQGFGEAATLGYLPQLQAGAGQLVQALTPESEADKLLKSKGFQLPEQDQTYTEMRDTNVQRGEQLQEAHPIASGVGQLAGGIATAPMFGGASGATALARGAQAAKTGATMGFLYNPGEDEGEISPVQLGDRLKNASLSAVTAGIMQGGAEGIARGAKIVKSLPGALKKYSELKAFKASGAMLKDFRKQYGRKKVNDIGRSMIDHNIVALGDDVGDVAKKAVIMQENVGKNIGSVYKDVDDLLMSGRKLSKKQIKTIADSNLDATKLADEMAFDILDRHSGKVGGRKTIETVMKDLEDLAENGTDLTMSKWNEIRRSIDDQVNWAKMNEPKPVQQEYINLRNKMQDFAKRRLKAIDDVYGGNRSKEITKLNKDYSNLSEVSKMAKDKMAREESNAAFGLRERMSGGAGAIIGGMAGGVPGAIIGGAIGSTATKAARQYGTPAVSRIADKIGDVLENNPALLGEFAQPLIDKLQQNPREFAALLTNLMQDPEFRRKVSKKKIRPLGRIGR